METPLIRFRCGCGKNLKAPPAAVGRAVTCPRCNQPTLVVPDGPPQAAPYSPPSGRSYEVVEDLDDGYDEYDAMRARRRARAARQQLAWKLVAVAALALAAVVAVALAKARLNDREVAEVAGNAKPAPVRPPATQEPRPDPRPEEKLQARPRPVPDRNNPAPLLPDPPQQQVPDFPFFPPPATGGPFMGGGFPDRPAPKMVGPIVEEHDPAFRSDRPAKESSPGYFLRRPLGFQMAVSRLAYEESDAAYGRPLKMLDDELGRVGEIFSDKAMKALKAVPIWVEWDHTIPTSVRAFGVYYGGDGEGLLARGVDPRKAGCVCVLSLKTAYKLRRGESRSQNVLLHELSHVVHDKVWGWRNAFIVNAYEQAAARGLYDSVRHDSGRVGPAYAGRSSAEYFAELSCCYLDSLDYYPHNRAELREHDSVGYEMMTQAWGTPEQLEAARRRKKN